MIVYLDESGDLGCDFDGKTPSSHFVITLLVCHNREADKMIEKAASRAIKNKLFGKVNELKGAKTTLNIKKYFLRQLKTESCGIYALVVNKRELKAVEVENKHQLYNRLTCLLLKQLNLYDAKTLTLIVDKCKAKYEMSVFDAYLRQNLDLKQMPFYIHHHNSSEQKGLQAVDLFSWGIYRKYENQDEEWYQYFQSIIDYEQEVKQTLLCRIS